MDDLNEAFEKHIDDVLLRVRTNFESNGIEIYEESIEHVRNEMIEGNYTLYSSTNYNPAPSKPSKPSSKANSKSKPSYIWKFHPDNRGFSVCQDIEEGVIYLRSNLDDTIIGTIGDTGSEELTKAQASLIKKLGLKC